MNRLPLDLMQLNVESFYPADLGAALEQEAFATDPAKTCTGASTSCGSNCGSELVP